MTKYVLSEEYKVCDISSETSLHYSVELTSIPINRDSMMTFQIVENHSHNKVKLVGYDEYIYRYNQENLKMMAFNGVSIGIYELICPPLVYVGYAGLLLYGIWSLDVPKPKDSDYEPTGKLTEVTTTLLPNVVSCPITKKAFVEDDIVVKWQDDSVNVKSSKDGTFQINAKKLFYVNRKKGIATNLNISSKKLRISQDIEIENSIKTIDNKDEITFSESSGESSRQLRLAENVYWNSSSKNTKKSLKDSIYWFSTSAKRIHEMSKISDQRLLRLLLNQVTEFDERKIAFNKLTKKSLLIISQSSEDQGLVLASKLKLNLTNWNSILYKPTKTNDDLRNIIRAAALIDYNPKPDNADIVQICHIYIRLGEDSHIPELCDLLSRFGDKTLSEDYLNCGKQELEYAGTKWLTNHGYVVVRGNGSHRVNWGESR